MTLLTYIQHPRYAQAFADYLRTLGIVADARQTEGTNGIWLQDAAQLPRAQQELSAFLAEPNHPRYLQASWLVDEPAEPGEKLAPYYRGPSIWAFIKTTGWVTKLVFAVCLAVYIYTNQGEDSEARAPLMFFHDVSAMADSHQYWRWLTPAVVHFGILHFSFNLFSWWIFGGIIERAQSSLRLLGIFLTCALVGNWTEFFWSRDNFGGLSGVVYGLLGYLWFYDRFSPHSPIKLPIGMIVFMLVALAAGFTRILPIANMAHLGGLLTGCLLGAALAKLDVADAASR